MEVIIIALKECTYSGIWPRKFFFDGPGYTGITIQKAGPQNCWDKAFIMMIDLVARIIYTV